MNNLTQPQSRITSAFGATSTALEVVAGHDLGGKTAIVTGGASGLGIETARALATAGADVVIAVRDLGAGATVAAEINGALGRTAVSVERLDLSDLASVRAFAARWGDRPLNLLINNAGVMACPKSYTTDGFETQLGVNHLGHFLLTMLLTPALEKGAPARVIALSSSAHAYSAMDFDDPHFRDRDYAPFVSYGQSKTANALFALAYDRRYRARGVQAFSVMPGVIETNLGRHMTSEIKQAMGITDKPSPAHADRPPIRHKNAEQGAATSVWAAVAPELEGVGGLYLEHCAQALPFSKDLPRGEGFHPHAQDPDAAERLWDWSLEEVERQR